MPELECVKLMATSYRVVDIDPRAVGPELVRLWQDNLPLATDAQDRFDWMYQRAPDVARSVSLLAARESDGPEEVVGCAGIAERRLQLGAELASAAQLVDLAVDSAHRSLGPALELVRESRRAALAQHAVAYGLPNALARPVFRRVGYRELGAMTRFVCVLRHRPYFEQKLGSGFFTRVSSRVLDAAMYALQAPAFPKASERYTLALGDDVDQSFDRLWQEAHAGYDVVGWRGAAFLRWRFLDRMLGRARIASLRAKSDASLRAYAVLELAGDAVHVRDLFGHRSELPSLLDLLLPELRSEGVASVSFSFLGSSQIRDWLLARGFVQREQEPTLFFDTASVESRERLADPERWHVTDADDDP